MKLTKTITTLILVLAAAKPANAERAASLEAQLISDGYEKSRIERLFQDNRFEIYENIEKLYKKTRDTDFTSHNFGYISESNIEKGIEFVKKHQSVLEKAEKTYGVGKEYVTAIYALENGFGKFLGDKPVFNSLVTNCLHKRKGWFYSELKHYLNLKDRLYTDEYEIKGSYSGAFGYPQAMPSSFKKYGIDFNGDGKINPFEQEDTIGFIAKFLSQEGFCRNKRKAIYSYNPSKNYADAVMLYAQKLRENK